MSTASAAFDLVERFQAFPLRDAWRALARITSEMGRGVAHDVASRWNDARAALQLAKAELDSRDGGEQMQVELVELSAIRSFPVSEAAGRIDLGASL